MRKTTSPLIIESIQLGLRLITIITSIILTLYALSGIFTVEADEVGFISRFGNLVESSPTTTAFSAGMHFALPPPIDEIYKIPVKKIIELDIQSFWKNSEDFCITQDQYFVRPRTIVKLRITNPQNVLFRLKSGDLQQLVTDIVSSELIKAIATFEIDSLLSTSKQQLTQLVKQRTNIIIDQLELGVQVLSVELREIVPPLNLIRDFAKVQDATIQKQTLIKEARTFEEKILREAQVQANDTLSEAKQYANTILQEANSETTAFFSIYQEWKKSPVVILDQVYYDAIQEIFSNVDHKIFVPSEKQTKIRLFLGVFSAAPKILPQK
ncbi:protease modulator HflK [Deltaproteobacteria bacterium TL4]